MAGMQTLKKQAVLVIAMVLLIVLGVAAVFLWWPTGPGSAAPGTAQPAVLYPPPSYVGGASCIECHQQEHDLWKGSHHDLAMQHANEQTVLGDFNNATFTHYDVTSTFFKKDGKFFVNTDGPDGELHDYEITYTFGVTPLQQYLIEFPGGCYQVLGICWDSRPASEGGQRWYHLYSDEPIPHDDILHWTGPNQNWNFMCAECHSTDLRKNYDLKTDSYKTTWEEINVSCEACHGPASNHNRWAERSKTRPTPDDGTMGFLFQMNPDDEGTWQFDELTNTAARTQPRQDQSMLHMCARCHARRSVVAGEYEHGQDFLDTHRTQLLSENLYHPDGQILDEVYVYGSFLQSKMYQQGVTCIDCHEPHSMQVYSKGNSLCATCHKPDVFDTPEHHFHEQGTLGASCVECHMPTQTYMGVDERLDHSIRVPRPDLSMKLGTPNACNKCHSDQSYEWAQQAVLKWYGPDQSNETHYGQAILAGQNQQPNADNQLAELASNAEAPGIARATAVSLLKNYPSRVAFESVMENLKSDDPLIRFAAVGSLDMASPEMRLPLAYDLLDDSVLTVRLEAARVLAAVEPADLSDEQRLKINQRIEAYIESQLANADRAESHLNIALIHTQRGQTDLAEQSYRTAISTNPAFAQSYVNLADLYRMAQRDSESVKLLQDAVDSGVKRGVIYYSLGLALVRMGDAPGAIKAFERAMEMEPGDPQFGYTLGIALNSTGEPMRALQVLSDTHKLHPANQSTLYALMTISRDSGEWQQAITYANTLLELKPDNANAIHAFIQQTKKQLNSDQ